MTATRPDYFLTIARETCTPPKHDLFAPHVPSHRADGPADDSVLAVAYTPKHRGGDDR